MVETEILITGKRVKFEPLKDINYFVELAVAENDGLYTKEQIAETIKTYGQKFWALYLDGTRRGVVGYFIYEGTYLMEALKDHSAPPTGIGYSIEVGQVVLEYLFNLTDKVRTFARIKDVGIQILCKKLGFKEVLRHGDFIIYEKGRGI